MATATQSRQREKLIVRNLLDKVGPALITGASDDDPSGIATYSQMGAQFGYEMLWTMVFSYPLMAVIQEISARIGRVTGVGIAGNIRRHYPPSIFVHRCCLRFGLAVSAVQQPFSPLGMCESLATRRLRYALFSLTSSGRRSLTIEVANAMSASCNGSSRSAGLSRRR